MASRMQNQREFRANEAMVGRIVQERKARENRERGGLAALCVRARRYAYCGFESTSFQVTSGSYSVIAGASVSVSGPRFFS
jgi:hypothetical protein